MPQLNQLPDVILSQLFWLALVLGFIYFVIARGMVPKIQATVDQRDQRIAEDLAAAERAKADADATEEAYRAKMDESRAEAMKLTGAAKQEGALATEKRLAKADKSIQDKAAKAEAKVRESREAALANLEGVAAELAQDIASKVANVSVSKDDAAKAVKAALSNV